LRRFPDVCNTIAFAHSRGVVHRDLKPGNSLLGRYGKTLVVDWGLAKSVGRTVQGELMGTPASMSPEQAAGRIDQLGPASDVYSLGATLYCLLTGSPPLEKQPRAELLPKVWMQGQRDVSDGPVPTSFSSLPSVPRIATLSGSRVIQVHTRPRMPC
jgi:serine/threonine protein kinase